MSEILLFERLKEFFPEIDDESISEISVNKPGSYFIGIPGHRYMQEIKNPNLTLPILDDIYTLTAPIIGQKNDKKNPILSAYIPSPKYKELMYRMQFICSPAVENNVIAFSLRRPNLLNKNPEDYIESFEKLAKRKQDKKLKEIDEELRILYKNYSFFEFIKKAILYKKNIIISAVPSSGKTTFMNALLKLIDKYERIITIEDVKELRVIQKNVLNLFFSKGDNEKFNISPQSLFEACLRLRPDRVLMGELRGSETASFLNLISCIPGTLATMHAYSIEDAFNRLGLMVLDAGTTLRLQDVYDYVKQHIDIIIQLKTPEKGDFEFDDIYFKDMDSL